MSTAIVKDLAFERVSDSLTVDAKNRVSLESAGPLPRAFAVYRNPWGHILLDPVRDMPDSEAWLWHDPTALAAVARGIQQADRGEVIDLGDFTAYLDEEA